MEAEFPEKVPRLKGAWVNERFASATMLALLGLGYPSSGSGAEPLGGAATPGEGPPWRRGGFVARPRPEDDVSSAAPK